MYVQRMIPIMYPWLTVIPLRAVSPWWRVRVNVTNYFGIFKMCLCPSFGDPDYMGLGSVLSTIHD